MHFIFLDYAIIVLFFGLAIFISLHFSKKNATVSDYFLAGQKLPWWVIGFALLATGISAEQTVGVAGEGYRIGLGISSFQWLGSIALVIVALFFLPKFLRAGIMTIPEYLEYRYNSATRAIVAIMTLLVYILGPMATVTYLSAEAFESFFSIRKEYVYLLITISSAFFILYGGLSSVVWTDLIFVSAVLISCTLVTVLGLIEIGGLDKFADLADNRLHAILPANNPDLPWPTVFFGGLWIAHIYFWGFNQFTTQRAFAASSLSEGQKGMLLTSTMLLFYSFILVFPGIIAYELYGPSVITHEDLAFPTLVKNLLPAGLKGFVFAAMFGGVIASLNNMFNSASSIFTLDLFKRFIKKNASDGMQVKVGRLSTFFFIICAAVFAPVVGNFMSQGGFMSDAEGGYNYLQTLWGVITPSIVAIFLVGFLSPKTPGIAAILALISNPVIYISALKLLPKTLSELDKMGITFLAILAIMIFVTFLSPLKTPHVMPEKNNVRFERNLLVFVWGIFIVILTASLYTIFL